MYDIAHLVKNLKSLCPNKELCGSCGWSHIPYDAQLQQKLSDINGALAKNNLSYRCEEILPSPKTSHYRNRMDFVINFEGLVGLREKGKWWRVIDDHTCFISDETIEDLFAPIRNWVRSSELSFYDRKSHQGFLRYAVVRATATGDTLINVVTSLPSSTEEEHKAQDLMLHLAESSGATNLVWVLSHTISDRSVGEEPRTLFGPGYLEESIAGFQYRVSPQAFFQTNSYASHLLIETTREFLGDISGSKLLDLYCGSGFFSIALAGQADRTLGVELVPEAIADAKVNAKLNQVEVEYVDAKTEEYDWTSYGADIAILDPPRSGLHKTALRDVIEKGPATVLYVACSYKNFARELVSLQKTYSLQEIRAIDMFPHTPHVELVSLLKRC